MRAVIDVGSNSVRLFIEGQKNKEVTITRLADGLSKTGRLSSAAIINTAHAVNDYVNIAREKAVDDIYIFATQAVRSAQNGKAFCTLVNQLCEIDVDVVDGDTEAKLAFWGAGGSAGDAVIDIGGGSTEISGEKQRYSLPLGAVVLTDTFGQDYKAVYEKCVGSLKRIQIEGINNWLAVSGTVTTLAAIKQKLDPYDSQKVHNTVLGIDEVTELCKQLYATEVGSRAKRFVGLHEKRAEIISAGTAMLQAVMERFDIKSVTVSENDNMEGYLYYKDKNV